MLEPFVLALKAGYRSEKRVREQESRMYSYSVVCSGHARYVPIYEAYMGIRGYIDGSATPVQLEISVGGHPECHGYQERT